MDNTRSNYVDLIPKLVDHRCENVLIDINANDVVSSDDRIIMDSIQAIGWRRFINSIGEKNVWNGILLKPISVIYEEPIVKVSCQLTDYVTLLGSNYGVLQKPEELCEFFSRSSVNVFTADFNSVLSSKRFYISHNDYQHIQKLITRIKNYSDSELLVIREFHQKLERIKRNPSAILKCKYFANCLSINIVVMINDSFVIQKHGKKAGHGDDFSFQTSAAGFIKMDNISTRKVTKSLQNIINEVSSNELNLDILSDYVITSVVIDRVNCEVGITVLAKANNNQRLPDLCNEECRANEDFFMEKISDILTSSKSLAFMPLGWAAIENACIYLRRNSTDEY